MHQPADFALQARVLKVDYIKCLLIINPLVFGVKAFTELVRYLLKQPGVV